MKRVTQATGNRCEPRTPRAESARSACAALTLAALALACSGSRAGESAAASSAAGPHDALGVADASGAPEPIVGLPCEGCEAVFQGLPAELGPQARLAGPDEPGEPMRLEGTVRDRSGQPAEGVIVYAYHTDARGIYPSDERFPGQAAYRHGRLRGWARTDREGRYRFDTIRPASYPRTTIPAHVHLHVLEPGRCTYFIDDLVFDDDPHLGAEARRELAQARGGNGVGHPTRASDGTWLVTRDIALGQAIPGYPER